MKPPVLWVKPIQLFSKKMTKIAGEAWASYQLDLELIQTWKNSEPNFAIINQQKLCEHL